METITQTNPQAHIKLDQCFVFVEREQLQCGEETINNLIEILNVIDYKSKKYKEEEMKKFKENGIDNILKIIEELDSGIKIGNSQTKKAAYASFKQLTKVKSSLRAINVKRNNLTVT